MARGKVQMRRIENPVHRQVTFCKRRMGLLKKAKELSVLCDADIGVMVFSPHGKVYELATNGNMQGLIERYKGSNTEAHGESSEQNKPEVIQQEVLLLRQEIDLLQKGLRYMYGENDINHMNLNELQALESNLEIWVHNIRYTKVSYISFSAQTKIFSEMIIFNILPLSAEQMQIISREIEMLKTKEGILKAANDILQERIIEQSGILDTGSNMMMPQFPFQRTMEGGYYF
ncbi:MADS-box transcription factor 26 isoform X1 [Triticum aestivum]|uniref:MADS-box transcription factor 26 isoform X1 n=1 Tax=Triticum aestivum TaxID=4565 RepID=UPI001D0086AE|nr:MADS-box transcription factor 26-like isoform X1 [Triticum aestivum]